MKILHAAVIACLLLGTISCGPRIAANGWPKYGDKEQEIQLPQCVLDSANCTVPNFEIPWYKHHAAATIELVALQQTNRPVIGLRSMGVTHAIGLFEYNVTAIQQGEFPEKTVSFLTFTTYVDGVLYSQLILPERSKFFLNRENGQYRILSIEGEGDVLLGIQ